jgi:hypothetical protein
VVDLPIAVPWPFEERTHRFECRRDVSYSGGLRLLAAIGDASAACVEGPESLNA